MARTPRQPGNPPPTTPDKPVELYQTSDIRFVMLEVQKLSTQVERLIGDVKDQGTDLKDISHKVTFVKGAFWVVAGGFAIFLAALGLFLGNGGYIGFASREKPPVIEAPPAPPA